MHRCDSERVAQLSAAVSAVTAVPAPGSELSCPAAEDLAVVAENYGQMTGVLAGFAFTALVFLLAPQGARRVSGSAPLALLVTFINLVIATLLYSVQAGQGNDVAFGRLAAIELIDGLVFGVAVLLLFHGITELMLSADLEERTVRVSRAMTVVVVPALAMYFMAEGAADTGTARLRQAGVCELAQVPRLGQFLTLALVVILAAALTRRGQKVVRVITPANDAAGPTFVLAIGVVGAIVSGNLNVRSPGFLMSERSISVYLLLAFGVLLAAALILSRTEDLHQKQTRKR